MQIGRNENITIKPQQKRGVKNRAVVGMGLMDSAEPINFQIYLGSQTHYF